MSECRHFGDGVLSLGEVVIDGTMLHDGGPAATVDGVVLSEGLGGLVVTPAGTTTTMHTGLLIPELVLTIGTHTLTVYAVSGTANEAGDLLFVPIAQYSLKDNK